MPAPIRWVVVAGYAAHILFFASIAPTIAPIETVCAVELSGIVAFEFFFARDYLKQFSAKCTDYFDCIIHVALP